MTFFARQLALYWPFIVYWRFFQQNFSCVADFIFRPVVMPVFEELWRSGVVHVLHNWFFPFWAPSHSQHVAAGNCNFSGEPNIEETGCQ